jgi:hypothetical protein
MYIRCLIEYADDKTQMEVIIKTTNDYKDDYEDDKIFFYGLSENEIREDIKNGTLVENEWKILDILEDGDEI